jgi:hypothetical protein
MEGGQKCPQNVRSVPFLVVVGRDGWLHLDAGAARAAGALGPRAPHAEMEQRRASQEHVRGHLDGDRGWVCRPPCDYNVDTSTIKNAAGQFRVKMV